MKILVTGHKGFIGQNLVEKLKHHQLSFFEWGDEIPSTKNLDWVIHIGAISATTETNVEKILYQNLDFSCWLLNECNENGVNFQYSSSASVYGYSKEFRETTPVSPRNPYAWSKYLFERFVNTRRWNVITQGFRYFNVYGPHEDHKGSQASPYHKFTQQAKNDKKIKLFKNSHLYRRDFVPVEYIVDVHEKFLKIPKSGIWNIGTGTPKSFEDVAKEVIQKYPDAVIEYIDMPEELKGHYQDYTCADTTLLKETMKSYA